METIDEQLLQQENTHDLVFVSLGPRVGALILDWLVWSPSFFFAYYNLIHLKSVVLMLLTSLLGIAYKPLCEYFFGYTLGKKWLHQCVINKDGLKPTLKETLLRNVFHLGSGLFSIYTSFLIFQHPEFMQVTTYAQHTEFVSQHNDFKWFQMLVVCLFFVDAIVLWRDPQRRSLHDKIATTWVVKD